MLEGTEAARVLALLREDAENCFHHYEEMLNENAQGEKIDQDVADAHGDAGGGVFKFIDIAMEGSGNDGFEKHQEEEGGNRQLNQIRHEVTSNAPNCSRCTVNRNISAFYTAGPGTDKWK